jgi:hypothetical protein
VSGGLTVSAYPAIGRSIIGASAIHRGVVEGMETPEQQPDQAPTESEGDARDGDDQHEDEVGTDEESVGA